MAKWNECYLCGGKLNGTYCPACGFDTARKDRIHYRLNESNASRRLEAEDDLKLLRQSKRKEREHKKLHNHFNGESAEVIKARREAAARKSSTGTDNSAAGIAKYVVQSAKDSFQTLASELKLEETGGKQRPGNGFQLADSMKTQSGVQPGTASAYSRRQSAGSNTWNISPKIRNTTQGKVSGMNRGVGILILVIFVVVVIIAAAINAASDSVGNDSWADVMGEEEQHPADTTYDPYEYVESELAETGDNFKVDLAAGEYLVGTHLPEGNYTVYVVEGYGTMEVEDARNGIYLYEWFSEDEEDDGKQQMEDVRLFEGGKISVDSGVILCFVTENGQTDYMSVADNPVTDSIDVEMGTAYECGVDFEPGVYDIYDFSQYGVLYYTFPNSYYDETDEYSEEYFTNSYFLDQSLDSVAYRNVVLLPGAMIWSDDADFVLVPSPEIGNIDYETYYEYW